MKKQRIEWPVSLQRRLAERAGVTVRSVAKYLRGEPQRKETTRRIEQTIAKLGTPGGWEC